MANQVSLSAELRTELGKGATGRLRKTGRTPAVLYGHGVEPTPVHVDALELYHVLHTEAGVNAMIKLDVDGETHLSIARELQRHPVMGDVTHLDFLAVDKDSEIVVELPVHITGEPADAAGVVQQVLLTVPVKVKPLEVPTAVDISVDGLTIGDVLRVKDLQLPAGVVPDIDEERTVVTVNAPQILEVSEDSEESVLGSAAEGSAPESAAEVPAEED